MKKENRFCSLDVTYTITLQLTLLLFHFKEGGRQRSNLSKHLYTNAIITTISCDGINRTSCIRFTHDPIMAKEQKKTAHGKRVRAEFEDPLSVIISHTLYNLPEE